MRKNNLYTEIAGIIHPDSPESKKHQTLIAYGRQNRPGVYEIETSPGVFTEIDEAGLEKAKRDYGYVLVYINCSLQFPDER